MFWKIVTLAVLIAFAWWRLRQFLRERRLRNLGEPVPEKRGIRPISILAAAMLVAYGGYLLWVVASQTFSTFGAGM
ncbi:hypothetical protein TVNIR_1182 [Thioalkalivibrio nitratireducens DSM 14787]|uniref:Uncharacterized protein n=1 Tax=Thioalkalivibrio nitratireducens (strain DSM 14787 / UNIQEM 213 / ALEN2) TaxID=1255043 RepID=L0DV33_THIND|nr:hypothetical protein [Thioalkalivibrio nitratireducens]AGA32857.1 hypothetical protein TVNIR_1182 [Thioalkalivibrio nitratireducens DSM 14787]